MGGDVPTQKYVAGAVMGGILSAMMGGLGITVGLGFYLPFNIVLTYSLGTLGRELSDRINGKTWSEEMGKHWSGSAMRYPSCWRRSRRRS